MMVESGLLGIARAAVVTVDARACRLVISGRNNCARNAGAEHTLIILARDYKNNYGRRYAGRGHCLPGRSAAR